MGFDVERSRSRAQGLRAEVARSAAALEGAHEARTQLDGHVDEQELASLDGRVRVAVSDALSDARCRLAAWEGARRAEVAGSAEALGMLASELDEALIDAERVRDALRRRAHRLEELGASGALAGALSEIDRSRGGLAGARDDIAEAYREARDLADAGVSGGELSGWIDDENREILDRLTDVASAASDIASYTLRRAERAQTVEHEERSFPIHLLGTEERDGFSEYLAERAAVHGAHAVVAEGRCDDARAGIDAVAEDLDVMGSAIDGMIAAGVAVELLRRKAAHGAGRG